MLSSSSPQHTLHTSFRTQRSGQSLIEIVVAMGMVVFFGAGFVTLVSTNYGRLEQSRDQSQATLLGQEAINIIRAQASTDFASVGVGTFGLVSGALTPNADVTGVAPDTVFTRSVAVAILNRLANGEPSPNNALTNATPDPESKLVKVSVNWQNQYKSGGVELYTILSTWQKGGSIVFDTDTDFGAAGAQYHTAQTVKELFNGEVRVSQAGGLETPANIVLNPEVVLENNGNNHDITLDGDSLFAINENELKVYDIGNVSPPAPASRVISQIATNSLTLGKAIAVSNRYIFVGTGNAGSEVQVYDRATFTETSWDLPGTGIVTALFYDKLTNRLLVTRTAGISTDKTFYALNVPLVMTTNVASLISVEQRLGTETPRRVVTDGKFAYIGTTSDKIFAVCLWSGCGYTPRSIVTFNPSSSPIDDLLMVKSTLYVGRDANVNEPELMSFQVKWNLPLTTVSLVPLASAEIGKTVVSLSVNQDLSRIVATTDQNDIRVLSLSLGQVSAFAAGTSSNGISGCSSAVYEAGRVVMSCLSGGKSKLFITEDTVNTSLYAPYASYTTPATCVSGAFDHWKYLTFQESGLGYVDVQVRSAATAGDLAAAPWKGPGLTAGTMSTLGSFSDDTLWHDITGLETRPCIQARVRFHASASCPLYLETLTFTYE